MPPYAADVLLDTPAFADPTHIEFAATGVMRQDRSMCFTGILVVYETGEEARRARLRCGPGAWRR
jgi:hypothetical protein